jgi:transposase
MRPPSVYANPSCPAGCPCDVARLLHGPHRVGVRLVMILLSQRGWPASAIAELLGCDPATVRRWIHRYNTHGTGGLGDQPRAGRPRLGSPRLHQRIRRLLARPTAWTIGRLWSQLGRPAISQRTLRRRVREAASWRRPRLVAKGDPNREQVLTGLRQTIAELPQGAVVLAEDETHVNLLPWVRATWIAHGTRQQVMTPGTNRRRTIFGAIDLDTGRWFYQVTRKAVSASFTAFLEQLLAAYPAAPLVAVVCDNVIIHHSKIVGRWLAAHPRVLVLHGARYSPHDNPVQRIWGALTAGLANSPTLTIQAASARCMASSATTAPPSCWRPPPRTAHHGCPPVTCRTSGRLLRIGLTSRLGTRRTASVWPAAQWPCAGLRRVGGGMPEESVGIEPEPPAAAFGVDQDHPAEANGQVVERGAGAGGCQV